MKNTPLLLIIITLSGLLNNLQAQSKKISWTSSSVFNTGFLIENHGQFEQMQPHVKDVKFAIQHNGDEFYFTTHGYSVQVGKVSLRKGFHEETREERMNESVAGKDRAKEEEEKEEEEIRKYERKSTWIDMEWLDANKDVEIICNGKTGHYFTYGEEKYSSFGYKTITYKNLYNGIDVEYEVHPESGIEYTLILHPGADLSQVKYQYAGEKIDVRKTTLGLEIKNSVKSLIEKEMIAFYADNNNQKVPIRYQLNKNVVSFVCDEPLDASKKLVIDPWVTSITTLSGINSANNTGYDVDNDAVGNLYVFGGGGDIGTSATSFPKVAKYDINGNLLWTFSGVIVSPSWNTSPGSTAASTTYARAGNFVVNKQNSKCYISQGLNISGGGIIARIDGNGIYDNFITTANAAFQEIWEMKINCITSQVMGIGGGTSSNINFGVIDTTSGLVNSTNVTGLPGAYQDAVNAAIGPSGEFYIIFVNTGNNDIYKLTSSTSLIWNATSGGSGFSEQMNKPYVGVGSFSNGYNCLSANQNYLFFYNGHYLKCFNSLTGMPVGNIFTVPFTSPMIKGGIYANSCNEVFVGGGNGNVEKYLFNGTSFILQSSLIIPGQAGKSVHDIIYNANNNSLYVCGDGFVCAVDPLSTCPNATVGNILLSSQIICPDKGIVTITNPDPNIQYSFIWKDSLSGSILQNTQAPLGVFADTLSGMVNGQTYQVTVLLTSACQIISSVIYLTANCSNSMMTVYVCPGDTYTLSNGAIISIPGAYQDTLTNIFGQDSIVTVNLLNYATSSSNVYASICAGQSYLLPDGTNTILAGIYIDSFMNTHGCDSIITTFLNVYPTYNSNVSVTICSNQTYTLPGGAVVNTSGIYTDSIQNMFGCDSVVITTLTVNPISTTNQVASICQGDLYLLPDGTQTGAPGIHISYLGSQNGCDSIIVVDLEVRPTSTANKEVTICSNQFYTLPDGTNTNVQGVYKNTFTNSAGCDSTLTTILTVTPLPLLDLGPDTTLCRNTPIVLNADINNPAAVYLWNDNTIAPIKTVNTKGIYMVTVTVDPCPSVSDTLVIDVTDCNCHLSIPNAFSPNGDLTNDIFRPLFTCTVPPENYALHIFNRWGQEVFYTHLQEDGWDGLYRTVAQEIGTYMYFIQFTNPFTHEKEFYKGDITLVR